MKIHHGFSKEKCLTNFLEFFERLKKHVDKSDVVDIMHLDFQILLDKVPQLV